jgi:hypothetical protein
MFKYPLSFMIYSELFDNMPELARQHVYRRLYDVLAGKGEDGRALIEIVRDTRTNLPEYWK